MKQFWHIIQTLFAAIGAWLGFFLGGSDGLLEGSPAEKR